MTVNLPTDVILISELHTVNAFSQCRGHEMRGYLNEHIWR